MKYITILVPDEAVLASVDDPRCMFEGVNDMLEAAGKKRVFKVQLVGLSKEVKLHKGSFTVHTDFLLHEVKKSDLVFIPALSGNMPRALELNKDFIPWIVEQHNKGAEIASLCIGAFLLASTGLLDGRQCSTHWNSANEFRAMFPKVDLVDDRIITLGKSSD